MSASAQGLVDFVASSPSPYHCVETLAARLRTAGFGEIDERSELGPLNPGDRQFILRDGSLFAWIAGTAPIASAGFRLIGAHTDSPNLRLKPNPDQVNEGYAQWGVEVYGGVLLHTWLDRDLGISGRVAARGKAGVEMHMLRIDRPIARIPNLAIHLNRKLKTEGLLVNKQKHLPPMVGLGAEDGPGALQGLISAELGLDPKDVLGWDLGLHDVQAPVVGGLNEDFVFAPRMDNQASCYTALEALLALKKPGPATAGIILFDHEEVGSQSAHGAQSAWLKNLLRRLERSHTERAAGGLERAAAHSFLISADMAHGVHPNYADRHEGMHKPMLNGGPVIKTNSNQRYSSNAETAGVFKKACWEVDVPVQEFVNRTDLACGSTIGPITSAVLGVRGVDVGGAMLSMHSIREQAGAADVELMARVKTHLLAGGPLW